MVVDSDGFNYMNVTGCSLSLSNLGAADISGQFSGDEVSGSFEASFTLADVSPWTGVLRDESIPFDERFERYRDNVRSFDPDVDDWLKLTQLEIAGVAVISEIETQIGPELPSELKVLFTHDVSLNYDHEYLGPAFLRRWPNRPAGWPNLIRRELDQGVPEMDLPPVGSDLRKEH